MLNIRHGKFEIVGSTEEITNDFRCLLRAIKYRAGYALLDNIIQVIGEELGDAENDPGN